MQNYTVPLSKLAEHLDLETVYTPTNLEDIMICSPNVNRPGLIVTGYSKYFDSTRVQIIGLMETSYLSELTPELRAERVDNLSVAFQKFIERYTQIVDCERNAKFIGVNLSELV